MNDFLNHLVNEFTLPLKNPVLIFSLILLIILLAPLLLKRLNIPGIIGLIISGVIIGPYGLNILAKNSAVDLFSTIGLLYIMFIAGLELDMNEFRTNRNKSLLFGFFTFIVPLALGFPVCYFLLGFNFNASFLTASMFATHTLIAYPIASKFGVSKNQAVAITVGGTILTDTAVLIILAVVMGNAHGDLNQEFWLRLGISLSIFSAIMFLIIPRIAKWFFRNLESEKHSHYIFILSVVFFAAFLAQVAGVEPIIGAFVAGLALNKLIPHSSALMNRIEFIGNSLFIPFFLISVGMLVDVKIIFSGPGALIIAASLTLVALTGKWLAAFFTQLVFRYSGAQRQLIFGLSSAHAAATLAIILVGFKAGILDENVLNGTIILILITCIVASFATEKAAKKIIVEAGDEAIDLKKTTGTKNEHILIPFAETDDIEKLVELSILIKDARSVNPLSILSVVSNDAESEKNILKTRSKLEKFVIQGTASETPINIITTIDFNTASGISRISREIMADIIILDWPRHSGIFDKFITDKIEDILDNTGKSVFVCHVQTPLVLIKRIIITAPSFAERESGFAQWVIKTAKLAQELSIPIVFFCNRETETSVKNVFTKYKLTASFIVNLFSDWDDFLIISREITADDMIFLISARKGSVSYAEWLDNIPSKLEKHFSINSKLIIYPQQYEPGFLNEGYNEYNAEPLNIGIATVQKIGKEISGIFKKK